MFRICIQSKSIHPAPKIAHLRNLYEASVTAALFMIITFEVTKIDNHKNDGKMAHFPPPNPLLRELKTTSEDSSRRSRTLPNDTTLLEHRRRVQHPCIGLGKLERWTSSQCPVHLCFAFSSLSGSLGLARI